MGKSNAQCDAAHGTKISNDRTFMKEHLIQIHKEVNFPSAYLMNEQFSDFNVVVESGQV